MSMIVNQICNVYKVCFYLTIISFSIVSYANPNESILQKGDSYYYGEKVEKNLIKAHDFYLKAKKAGETLNPLQEALILENDVVYDANVIFTPKDPVKILGLYILADELGMKGAKRGISYAYGYIALGYKNAGDYSNAYKVYDSAYQNGYLTGSSIAYLAELYDKGKGTKKDLAMALRLYLESDEWDSLSKIKPMITFITDETSKGNYNSKVARDFGTIVLKHQQYFNKTERKKKIYDYVAISVGISSVYGKLDYDNSLIINALEKVKSPDLIKGSYYVIAQLFKLNAKTKDDLKKAIYYLEKMGTKEALIEVQKIKEDFEIT